jgi:hypothetical protein
MLTERGDRKQREREGRAVESQWRNGTAGNKDRGRDGGKGDKDGRVNGGRMDRGQVKEYGTNRGRERTQKRDNCWLISRGYKDR